MCLKSQMIKYLYILIALCISNGMFAQGHNHSDHEEGTETHKEPPHGENYWMLENTSSKWFWML